ncbi:hypothetical protein P280DRAFT_483170 [Massarina eburnea CBS 473.64]|uniref:Extracellular membrane protein CFEM domain-containing protein n=1 Tax=Massarina eburnea CBS 473.64 TaxID=1395130 RepID=A0A6A6RP23_9PLEO|nr:hypothetical protein P280DRAFT_483170 [Massarina eburnea CBS 473.64]
MRPPIPPCTIILLFFSLASAQIQGTACASGYNATCCPCVTSAQGQPCGDPQEIDELYECIEYHPSGWACCAQEGDWACVASAEVGQDVVHGVIYVKQGGYQVT